MGLFQKLFGKKIKKKDNKRKENNTSLKEKKGFKQKIILFSSFLFMLGNYINIVYFIYLIIINIKGILIHELFNYTLIITFISIVAILISFYLGELGRYHFNFFKIKENLKDKKFAQVMYIIHFCIFILNIILFLYFIFNI